MLIDVLKLRFADHRMETSFQNKSFQQHLQPGRIILLVGILMLLSSALLDYIMFAASAPDLYRLFLSVRVFLSFVASVVLMVSFTRFCRKYFVNLLALIVMMTAFVIITMIVIVAEETYLTYIAGLMLILLYIYAFLFPFWKGALLGFGVIVAYNFAIILFWDQIEFALWNNFFLAGSYIVGLFFSFYLEKKNRDNFLLNHRLSDAYAEIKELSFSDALTGAKNRRYFQEIIREEIDTINYLSKNKIYIKRNEKSTSFGLLLVDIDHFKQVNDRFGHEAGDRILKQFTNQLNANIRKDDTIIRWGGEEFLIVLRSTNLDHIPNVALALKRNVAANHFIYNESGDTIQLTCSIGTVSFPMSDLSLEEAIKVADFGLYHAKNHGRNKVVLLTLNNKIPININNIEAAVEDGHLTLFSQE